MSKNLYLIAGFLSTLDANSPGNFGLWDQLKLLEWLDKNIYQFGGDPSKVTAFGSGAGAASIEMLMLSFHTKRGEGSKTQQHRYYRTATLPLQRNCYVLCVRVNLKVIIKF